MAVIYYSDELQHYGVPGMKWGVRRNARVLANRRRNQAVRKTKTDYELGKITKSQKKEQIKEANKKKKASLRKMNYDIDAASNKQEFNKVKHDIARQTISEVPAHRIKKGLTTCNKILGTMHTTTNAAVGIAGATVAGPYASLVLSTYAVSAAAELGLHYLAQKGIDRLT